MRAIPVGFGARHELTVSEAMTVDFEQDDPRLGKLHDVYATYWLTKHVELVSRKILLPFLEEGDAGIGFEVAVKHVASALPGMRVGLVAEHLRTDERPGADGNVTARVYVRCEAVSELGDLIGRATTTQVVMPRASLEASFRALRERWDAYRGGRVRGPEGGS